MKIDCMAVKNCIREAIFLQRSGGSEAEALEWCRSRGDRNGAVVWMWCECVPQGLILGSWSQWAVLGGGVELLRSEA